MLIARNPLPLQCTARPIAENTGQNFDIGWEMNAPPPFERREDDLRAHLECGCSDSCTRLIVSPGSGCTWADHWYVDAALKIKSQFGGEIRCVLQWTADFEAINQRARPNNWKAVLLESQLQARSSGRAILLGHSSGGNAALEVAERYPVDSLVVLGAGYCDHDRRCSDIQHWDYDAIVSNVRRRIVVLHGADDHVVRSSEGDIIAQGLRAAVARAGGASCPRLDTSVREAGIGHAMQQRCPPALSHVLSSVILESCQD